MNKTTATVPVAPASARKLSWSQKMAYGSGSLTNNLLPAALGVFMYFLVTGFGIPDPLS